MVRKPIQKPEASIIGKFKDEAAGRPIIEFVGLKSKMYSYKTASKNNKTAKGAKKNIIKRDIDHSDYLHVLFNHTMMKHKMKSIRSEYPGPQPEKTHD